MLDVNVLDDKNGTLSCLLIHGGSLKLSVTASEKSCEIFSGYVDAPVISSFWTENYS